MGEFSDYGPYDPAQAGSTGVEGLYDPNASYDMPYDDATDPALLDDTLPGEEEIPFDPEDRGAGSSDITIFGSHGGNLPALPNLGIFPQLGGGQLPAGAVARGGTMNAARAQATARRGAILHAISARLGRRIALHAVAALVGKWGLPAAAAALGVGAEDLLFLIAQYAGARGHRGRRGPHLHTVVKRIRRGDHYRKLLSRWASKAGIHRHHAPAHHKKKR